MTSLEASQFYLHLGSSLFQLRWLPGQNGSGGTVVFSPHPASDLAVVNDEGGGVRLRLPGGLATEDIRRFGQAPSRAGRRPPRRVCSEGLLGPAANGPCDLKAQDTARIGPPSPGQALVVTCPVSAHRVVYKGCTPDVRGLYKLLKREHPLYTPCAPPVHPLYTAYEPSRAQNDGDAKFLATPKTMLTDREVHMALPGAIDRSSISGGSFKLGKARSQMQPVFYRSRLACGA
jgi:hypothetical protein